MLRTKQREFVKNSVHGLLEIIIFIAFMHTRDFYHRKAMKCDLPQFWEEYRKKRNEVTSSIRLAKQEYVQGLLNEKAGNSSTLWSTIKHLSSNVKDSSIKLNIDGKDVVEPEMPTTGNK